MNAQTNLRRVARVTIQFTTPFLVGSGEVSDTSDAVPVMDANGLPVIPGTSLAGILRHGFSEGPHAELENSLFGSAAGESGHGSRLWVSWAHIHDASDVPVDGLHLDGKSDAVLDHARCLSLRDHVRIGHRGAAADTGKFDQSVVPAGHRFTFELTLEGGAEHDERYQNDGPAFDWLLDYLASGRTRIGGSGRRGLGAFEVIRCHFRRFDLAVEADATDFSKLPVSLAEPAPQLDGDADRTPLPGNESWRTLVLPLVPLDYWAFNGAEPWMADGEEGKPPDFNPFRDERIEWKHHGAVVRGELSSSRLVLPGSGLKGPIAHRVAFHYNVGAQHYADDIEEAAVDQTLDEWTGENNPAVRELFGAVHDRTEEGQQRSCAGRVFIDDIWLDDETEARTQRLMHNSIDRFTGGVRGGILFDERVVYGGGPVTLKIQVRDLHAVSAEARAALRGALNDLAEGQLPIGAGSGRGHGHFELSSESITFDELWSSFAGEEA